MFIFLVNRAVVFLEKLEYQTLDWFSIFGKTFFNCFFLFFRFSKMSLTILLLQTITSYKLKYICYMFHCGLLFQIIILKMIFEFILCVRKIFMFGSCVLSSILSIHIIHNIWNICVSFRNLKLDLKIIINIIFNIRQKMFKLGYWRHFGIFCKYSMSKAQKPFEFLKKKMKLKISQIFHVWFSL